MHKDILDNGFALFRLASDGTRDLESGNAGAASSLTSVALSNALGIAQRVTAFEMMHGVQTAVSVPASSYLAPATGGLQINVTYDASVNSAPAGFKATVAGVVQFFESHFSDPVTVNIHVGWGEENGSPIGAGDGAVSESTYTAQQFSFAQIKAAMQADGKTADDATALASIGADFTGGGSKFSMTTAEAKALGLTFTTDNPNVDGYTGIDSASKWTFNTTNTDGSNVPNGNLDAFSFLAHEFSEILGRQMDFGAGAGNNVGGEGYYPYDLFDYSGTGLRSFNQNAANRYFSFDGGKTHIHPFGIAADGDPFDWANDGSATPDSFDAAGSVGIVSDFDLKLMDILGWDPVGSAAKPNLTVTNFAFDGAQFNFKVNNTGSASAGASTTGFYLSTDPTVTTADTQITTTGTGALAAGASVSQTFGLGLTGAQAPGVYYLAAIADTTGAVAESNETDNTSNVLPVLLGSNGAEGFQGGAGNDIIIALGGNDIITPGTGNDTIAGGDGNDTVKLAPGDLTSADIVNGDLGIDRLSFTGPVTLAASAFTHVSHIEQLALAGTASQANSLTLSDALVGSSDNNHILTVSGSAGNDTVDASAVTAANRVYIYAGGGNDTLKGGAGADIFYFATPALDASDTVNGGTGTSIDSLDITSGGTVTAAAWAGVSHVEKILLAPGFTHAINLSDALVGSADDNHVLTVLGGASRDGINAAAVTTAANSVRFEGLGGGDRFVFGAGADRAVYTGVSDSTGNPDGTAYDSFGGFNASVDRIDLPNADLPTSIATAPNHTLSSASFDTDMGNAVGAQLNAHTAVLFHANAGTLGGHEFLVINPTGTAGYLSGADYVIDVTGFTGTFATSTFI